MLASAGVSPGDFTATGANCDGNPACVYGVPEFILHEEANSTRPTVVPRSLNGIWNLCYFKATANSCAPSVAINGVQQSYENLRVIPVIHQFGFESMPFSAVAPEDGPISAIWEFQVLMKIRQISGIERVHHWAAIDNIPVGGGSTQQYLLGTGFISLLLDQYRGEKIFNIPAIKILGSETSSVAATIFEKAQFPAAIVVSLILI